MSNFYHQLLVRVCSVQWSVNNLLEYEKVFQIIDIVLPTEPEAATQRCSWEKVFWKYAANLQENTHAEVRFQ